MNKSQSLECRGASETVRSRTRQRLYKAPPTLDVPDIDQDAAERKRVLNVLAQRRYRKYKDTISLGTPLSTGRFTDSVGQARGSARSA
jgi:hypothetical protein